MSIAAAENFRQHVNRMSILQAELVACIRRGAIDYACLALLGNRSGFDFTPDEAKQVLLARLGELTAFERELVARGIVTLPAP